MSTPLSFTALVSINEALPIHNGSITNKFECPNSKCPRHGAETVKSSPEKQLLQETWSCFKGNDLGMDVSIIMLASEADSAKRTLG
jgi:hypothetical protein